MPETLLPADVIAAATVSEAALRPAAGRDWSVQAGPLEWDVAQTVAHMIAAVAKYTLYLASQSPHFIALSVTRWPDATNEEVIASLVPVAAGLAAVAAAAPPGARAYHATGPSSAADFIGRACVELLVHTGDALAGLDIAFAPPAGLCQRVLARQYPGTAGHGSAWEGLLAATGREVSRR